MIRLVPVLGIALIAVGLAGGGPCATTTTNVVKDCGAETAVGLIDDVNTALATDRYKQGLASLVAEFGECVIEKAVLAVLDKIGVRARYDEFEAVKQQRAKEWMAERGKPVASNDQEADVEIAVVNHSKLNDVDVAFMVEACNLQAIEACERWQVQVHPVTFYATAEGLPAANCRIMDLVDTIDVPGVRGYHTNEFGVIYGRVLADGSLPDIQMTLSHECIELPIDPSCAEWVPMPGGYFAVAKEASDPVQGDAYPMNVTLIGETRPVMLSNYVLPSWFSHGGRAPFDRMGLATAAFTMRPGGFTIVRDASGKQGQKWARTTDTRARAHLGGKLGNPDGRLQRRLLG